MIIHKNAHLPWESNTDNLDALLWHISFLVFHLFQSLLFGCFVQYCLEVLGQCEQANRPSLGDIIITKSIVFWSCLWGKAALLLSWPFGITPLIKYEGGDQTLKPSICSQKLSVKDFGETKTENMLRLKNLPVKHIRGCIIRFLCFGPPMAIIFDNSKRIKLCKCGVVFNIDICGTEIALGDLLLCLGDFKVPFNCKLRTFPLWNTITFETGSQTCPFL